MHDIHEEIEQSHQIVCLSLFGKHVRINLFSTSKITTLTLRMWFVKVLIYIWGYFDYFSYLVVILDFFVLLSKTQLRSRNFYLHFIYLLFIYTGEIIRYKYAKNTYYKNILI